MRLWVIVIFNRNDILASCFCLSRACARIGRAVEEMGLCIDTFLQLSREEELVLVEPYRLAALCRNTVDGLLFLVENRDVEIEIVEKYPFQLNLPPQMMQIAISNLLRNSIQHTERGTITLAIEEGYLQVTDTGYGVPKELLEKITLAGVKGPWAGGTGFGLAIVEQICRRLDVGIQVSNGVKGACVRMDFHSSGGGSPGGFAETI